MSELMFVRISATENTFLYLEGNPNQLKEKIKNPLSLSTNDFVKYWTNGQRGLMADGLVFVERFAKEDLLFKWHFYNCDGSEAEMCGNASRGLFLFAEKYLGFKGSSFNFETKSGLVNVERKDSDQIRVTMPAWRWMKKDIPLSEPNNIKAASLVNTGVPHFVIELSTLKQLKEMRELAKKYRFFPESGVAGTNITFYTSKKEGPDGTSIDAITFERGVEDFTKSCGTGAVAAAIDFLSRKDKSIDVHSQIKVDVPGGRLLVEVNDQTMKAYLSGDAKIDFEIHLP